MTPFRLMAVLGATLFLSACASTEGREGATASKSDGCRKVHIAGTRFPKTVCGKSGQGLTEDEKERLREAIGRPIVTERD